MYFVYCILCVPVLLKKEKVFKKNISFFFILWFLSCCCCCWFTMVYKSLYKKYNILMLFNNLINWFWISICVFVIIVVLCNSFSYVAFFTVVVHFFVFFFFFNFASNPIPSLYIGGMPSFLIQACGAAA